MRRAPARVIPVSEATSDSVILRDVWLKLDSIDSPRDSELTKSRLDSFSSIPSAASGSTVPEPVLAHHRPARRAPRP